MLKRIFSADPFKTFYFVFAYIVAFSLWWAYLLYAKNETAYKEKIELNEITYRYSHPQATYTDTPEFKQVQSKYQRQRVMILTEGTAFILLLVFGLFRVRRSFIREMELAKLQRNFLLSITHELKSPLSTIKLSLQTLAKHKLDAIKSERLITNSLVDVDRLVSLVENMLFAAKIERDEPGFLTENVSISELVSSLTGPFIYNKKGITIKEEIQPGVYLNTDIAGFTSVVINLVENAIKYSEPDTVVTVRVAKENHKVIFSVADQGMGIADEDKVKVFDKFYRVGNEDTRKTKGTGLGLYIVKRFVEIYKGSIEVDDNKPQGTIFRLVFAADK